MRDYIDIVSKPVATPASEMAEKQKFDFILETMRIVEHRKAADDKKVKVGEKRSTRPRKTSTGS